jgi:hypothetical protein
MTNLSIGSLSCSLAFGGYAWGQNPANDSRRVPTIEDRLAQLEHVQGDLTSQMQALNQKVTNHDEPEFKTFAHFGADPTLKSISSNCRTELLLAQHPPNAESQYNLVGGAILI